MGETIDSALTFDPNLSVKIICGDLNMARWAKNPKDACDWHEGTLEELTKRGFIPISDYSDECCFVAVHDSFVQSLHIKGSSWAERAKTLDPEQQTAFHDSFMT